MANVLFFENGKEPCVKEVNTLEDCQALVGGIISYCGVLDIECDDNVGVIVNDEGKLLRLNPHCFLADEDGNIYDCINGNFYVTRCDEDGEDIDITDEDIAKWTSWYNSHKVEKGSRIYDALKEYVDNYY